MAKRAARGERERRGRSTGGAIRRALGMLAFLPLASRIPTYGRLIWALLLDERIPATRKAVLGAALGYLVLGRDLVPDDLPIVGGLDDVVVVALAIDLFLDGVPTVILAEKLDELGIERAAYEDDIASIRRLMPGPVSRFIRRLPAAFKFAADGLARSGLGPRVRTWISREGSIA